MCAPASAIARRSTVAAGTVEYGSDEDWVKCATAGLSTSTFFAVTEVFARPSWRLPLRRIVLTLCFAAQFTPLAPSLDAEATTRLSAGGGCGAAVGGNLGPVPGIGCDASEQINPAPPGSVAEASGAWTDARLGTANSAGFSATAGFGVLKSSSFAAASTAPPLGVSSPLALGVTGSGFAFAIDDITFTAPGLAGQAGFASGSMFMTGLLEVSSLDPSVGSARASWDLSAEFLRGGRILASNAASGILQLGSQGQTGVPNVGQVFDLRMPVVFGQASQLLLRLTTSASAIARPAGAPGSPTQLVPVVSEASSLFSNTVRWQGIASVTLADGTPVEGWSAIGASGIDYGRVVPEPGTLLLTSLGTLGLAFWRARGRAGRSPTQEGKV